MHIAKDKKNILVLGDSHSAHLYSAAAKVFKNAQVSQLNASGCKPVLNSKGAQICEDLVNRFYQSYIEKYPFDLVIISARWKEEDLPEILKSVAYLKSKNVPVVVLGPVMEYDLDLPRVLAMNATYPEKDFIHQEMRVQKRDIDKKFRTAFKERGYNYISLTDIICPNGKDCTTSVNGTPLQFDYGHFTAEGAEFVLKQIVAEKKLPISVK